MWTENRRYREARLRTTNHADSCGRHRDGNLGFVPGIDVVMEATDFAAKLATADLVITGEGRIDEQTAFGKTALGVAKRAHAAGVPWFAGGGGGGPAGSKGLQPLGAVAIPTPREIHTSEEVWSLP